ncbi:unnamed protein product [Chondrus crispus]|uniref:Uncharacterized protein n=1 Tax=Chondrus crispus TaxID=2769 RepID=R7QDK3_CHOCR|nr:unnamed protein product [Chondrus crispus]CDF35490.1 unnamed protein product [Chondrus crispus]|eukprot:XP_005715309.1 unnamed protein product [Chondrus crispus]
MSTLCSGRRSRPVSLCVLRCSFRLATYSLLAYVVSPRCSLPASVAHISNRY